MTRKETDIPIKKNRYAKKRELEDYEPRASRSDVLIDLRKTAEPVKVRSQKRAEPPETAS